MPTEVWFRNPDNYIRELVECGEYKIAWDRGLLVKKRIDPIAHADTYFGKTYPWRVLLVGEQGSAEYQSGSTIDRPVAVYPTWVYGESGALLEELLAQPVGQDPEACMDTRVERAERPVLGQEHRVVIINPPKGHTGPGRQLFRYLKTLQEDYPDAIIHVHGLYSWKIAFGMGFGASDVEPRTAAQKGKVHLASGVEEKYERVQQHPQWVTALGFQPVDLEVPRNRCMYNIKSAVWAGENYDKLYNFKVKGKGKAADIITPDEKYSPPETKSYMTAPKKALDGDKFLCNSCSLQQTCKYFRTGAVCSVPGAEPVRLSKMFGSRNADDIIDGLSLLLSTNANRVEQGLRGEELDGELDKEVSKVIGQVFDQGTKLAKLLEPQRFGGGAKVQINTGGGGAVAISTTNVRQLTTAAVRELEQAGVPRDEITTEMIVGIFEGMANPEAKQKAIQGTVISSSEEPQD